MTHPASLVANCQFENRISIYTKKEREFMKKAMNSLSLSGNSGQLPVLQASERMWSDAG